MSNHYKQEGLFDFYIFDYEEDVKKFKNKNKSKNKDYDNIYYSYS